MGLTLFSQLKSRSFLFFFIAIFGGSVAVTTYVLANSDGDSVPDITAQFIEEWQEAPDYATWKQFQHQSLHWAQSLKADDRIESQISACRQLEKMNIDAILLLEDAIDELPDWQCLRPIRQRTKSYWQEKREKLKQEEMGDVPEKATRQDLSDINQLARLNSQLPKTEIYPVDADQGPIFFSGDLPDKYVALTLDDGPHPNRTSEILETLQSFDTKVTFFTVGENALRLPRILKAAASQGHSMGTHSQTHPKLSKIPSGQAQEEITDSFKSTIHSLGFVAPFFRFPFGARNDQLQQFVKNKGWATFFWNIDSLDWKHQDPSTLLAHCKKVISSEGRGIILFHDIHQQTVEIMPWLLRWLAQNNYQPVVFQATNIKQL
jgi:peptidoglycan/xylan/chitin deacetylase (PgdA/CDA1 family)